jgi:transketolase
VARHGLSSIVACRLAQRELARNDARFVVLEAHPEAPGGVSCREELSERHLAGFGAAASLLGTAGGLALNGKIPLVNAFSSFALIRACEQLRLDLCYPNADAKLFGGPPADAEPVHLPIQDLALARSMPNLTVVAPADAVAAYHATLAAGVHPGPVYIRLMPHDTPQVYREDCPFQIGRGVVLRAGGDLTLAAAGAGMVAEALAAAELLGRDGIEARVLDLHTIKPIDRALLAQAAAETELVITVEEHSVCGGLGGAVAEALGDERPVRMRILGLPDAWDERVEPRADRLRRHGLDAAGIAASARLALAEERS